MATYSTTNAPLPWLEPYLTDYASRAQSIANTPYQQSPGSYVGPNSTLQNAWQATANRAAQGSPVTGAANTLAADTLNGNYLNGNPYLQSQIDQAQGDLARNWNLVQKPQWDRAMQQSGSFGNTGVMQYAGNAANDLATQMGNIGSQMRFNAYNTERGLQNQALSMSPTLAQQDYFDLNALYNTGAQQQQFNNAQQLQNQQWWQEAQNFPTQQLTNYGTALGTAGGGGGTQTQTTPDPSVASQLAGGGLTGLALWQMLFGGK